ncbi:hypothetical protein N2152v2_008439 [Parachlorella kessleri]
MLTFARGGQRQLSGLAVRCLATHQEGLTEKLKHKAEDLVHRAEDVLHNVEHKVEEKVHRVQGYVHDKREHAREEAERGMFTADDITEVAAQFAQRRKGDQSIVETAVKTEERMAHPQSASTKAPEPESDEELLTESSQDFATAARQRELKGLQDLVKEDREA